MPTKPLDILSLEDAKLNLAIGGTTAEDREAFTALDTLLTDQITQAVSRATNRINVPLLDRDEVYPVYGYGDEPIRLRKTYAKAVKSLSYWQPSQSLREEPAGTIAVADLGRSGYVAGSGINYEIWPTASGWPSVLSDTCINLTLTRGIQTADIPKYKELVILYLKYAYDQEREIKPTSALNILAEQLQDWRV